MAYKIVYSTSQERSAAKLHKTFRIIVTGMLCGMGLLFLRDILAGTVLPDGAVLEQLAQMVEENEGSIAEVIATFCRGAVLHEAT